jgi:2-polyprenyl-3-methyl-5-hydroxy-6-metoxy-1,4-benzoquinol methylase
MNSKTAQVKSFFIQPERYLLRSQYNIRIRAEVVKGFVGDTCYGSILDIGCGDGSISLPLLRQDMQLTLLDISRNMLSVARSHIPAAFSDQVQLVNDDFMHAELGPQAYDLILCLGVLAHVDSP